jgi:DNA modification methylase
MRKSAAKKRAPTKRKSAPKQSSARAASTEVKITAAKGRPMLTWVGKAPLRQMTAFPAQHIETFDPTGSFALTRRAGAVGAEASAKAGSAPAPGAPNLRETWAATYPKGGILFHGDNKDVLAHLLASGFRGKVDLICIDPPFDSGADYVRTVTLRGATGTAKLDGEGYTLGEQIQYADIWANDTYLQFMYERLLLLKELLAENGSIYLHCDWHRNHQLRCVMDEVFGADHLVNEIVWQRTASHNDPGRFGVIHDIILLYSKGDSYTFNDPKVPQSEHYIEQFFVYAESPTGEIVKLAKAQQCPDGWRRFRLGNFASPHPRPNLTYKYKGYDPPANGWKVELPKMQELDRAGRLYFPTDKSQRIQTKSYLDEVSGGKPAPDLWLGMLAIQAQSAEREDYPTQKPEAVLERVVATSSIAGGIVLDCFIGSGTTAAVAQKLGRRWIACDVNKGAIQTTSKRLQTIIAEQAAASQGRLLEEDGQAVPAQLGFTVWRVNDYDLQIQHNEAVNLACEHIGIERTRSDGFFDGTLGNRLVKIIPFGHPLSPVDLEEIKRELEARPDEDRNLVAVCLGKEFAADNWLEDWNRHRKGKNAANRIETIELRTDPKYGKFFAHQPAKAKVKITRKRDKIAVEIEDFISPTILERLQQQAGLVKPTIDDWRAMVDCVMVDPAYNGEVFNIALSDVPEKKSDLVKGTYDLPAPAGKTTVAVKIVDMLGEEVLIAREV